MTNANEEMEVEDVSANDTTDEFGTDAENSSEATEEQDSSDVETDTVSVNRADYEKLQREAAAAKRLREKQAKTKESSGQTQEGGQALDRELMERTYLAAQLKIDDVDVQDEAIRLAKKFDMPITAAVNDPDIKTRLDNLIKQKKAQNAIAGGTGGSTSRGKTAEYYASEYKRTGKLPELDTAMTAKVLDVLARK